MEKPFRKYLIVMGAGSGVRMGSALPKQFLDLGGEPVLRRTIRVFLAAVPDIRVITVLPDEWIEYWKSRCIADGFDCPQTLVRGGITRFHSVRNAERVKHRHCSLRREKSHQIVFK